MTYCALSRDDRNRNDRLARLGALLPAEIAIVGTEIRALAKETV